MRRYIDLHALGARFAALRMSPLRSIPVAMLCTSICGATLAGESSKSFSCRNPAGERQEVRTIDTSLAGVPATLRIPDSVSKPPIILWHGFGPPDSEKTLMEALPLDDVPAIKVYLGLPLFGARAPKEGMKEVVRRQSEDVALLVFEPVVMGAARELPAVVRELRARGCIRPAEAIGVFGFSAGGASTLFALAEREVPIGAAVTLNASIGLSASVRAYELTTKRTYSWTPSARELAQKSDAPGRAADIAKGAPALLIIQGAEDAMVTPQIARTLHQTLLPLYEKANSGERVRLQVVPDLSHSWTAPGTLEQLRGTISEWFSRYL
jgi:predicted esterase